MGRIFEKRKHKMFARFDKMAKAFTNYGKEISMAVKEAGPDPNTNSRLRNIIQNAKAANMPKDRIDGAIKRASSKDEKGYEEVIYEGYAPHGIALLVVTATDNPTRTVGNVRSTLMHNGGTLGTAGSLSFMFERKGVFKISAERIKNLEEFELEMIDYGAEDISVNEGVLYISTQFNDFAKMQKALEAKNISATSAGIEYIPTTTKELPEAHADAVLELIAKLEEDDDVQAVFHTLE